MQRIYPENFELKIGFDRIREMLHNKCLSSMGSEWVDEMHFQEDFENIQNQLGEEVQSWTGLLGGNRYPSAMWPTGHPVDDPHR